MNKTSFAQKIGLFVFGLLAAFLLIEIALRLGGLLFFAGQERGNRELSGTDGVYAVLCVGESTTALGGEHAYPRQLETILNERQSGMKFEVINKGVPATTTARIVQNLPHYIKEYDPDMVVAMMGINDGLSYIRAEEGSWLKPVYGLRTVKLLRLLNEHLRKKMEERRGSPAEKEWNKLERQVNASPSPQNFTNLAQLYRAAGRNEKEFEALQKALKLDPNYVPALENMGSYYKRMGDYDKAVEVFQKALELARISERAIEIYAELAESFKLAGQYAAAENVLSRAIQSIPSHPGAYASLGEMYLDRGQYEEAIKLFEKQLAVNPKADTAYIKLAYSYHRAGSPEKAEAVLKEGIRHNPDDINLYAELAYLLLEKGDLTEAEKIIQQAVDLKLEDPKGVLSRWFLHYEARPGVKDSRLMAWFASRPGVYAENTLNNFEEIYNILRRHDIPLVVAQYPMRALEPLRRLFQDNGDVIFVDNERIFKEAVSREGYSVYFSDRFAGDFGHATAKGNFLLANRIAQAILAWLGR